MCEDSFSATRRRASLVQTMENAIMNANQRLAVALFAGVGIGVVAIESIHAQAPKPPVAYNIQEVEVTDPAGWKAYIDAAGAISTGDTRFIVRRATAVPLSGEPPKGFVTVVMYESVAAAKAHQEAPAYVALLANRDKSAKVRSYLVEGIKN